MPVPMTQLKGLDFLGLGSKANDIEMMVEVTPPSWAIGAFDGTLGDARFGDCIPALRKFLRRGVAAVRVHLWYNKAHTLCPLEAIAKRAPLYEKLASNHPDTKFFLSHSCEYNETSSAEVRARVAAIKKYAPHCIPVNAIWKGVAPDKTLIETHNPKAKPGRPYLISTDGEDIYNLDANRYRRTHADAQILFLWGSRFNLIEAHNTLPPQERTAAPEEKYIKGIMRLAEPEGRAPAPAFKGKIVPFLRPLLYKSFSEDQQGDGDPRANRPLTITPSESPWLEVVTKDGTEIARFKYFAPYPSNLQRHYSGTGTKLYGYEIGELAKKRSGSEYVWFRDGNTYYGPVSGAFRRGYYQNG